MRPIKLVTVSIIANICIGILLAFIFPITLVHAYPVPGDIKKTVAFIYAPGDNERVLPNGTGFFIALPNPQEKDKSAGYLVTAKHVLQKRDKKSFFPFILLRLNTKNGSSQMVPVSLVHDGANKNVFLHQDPSVDLAVIPVNLNPGQYDLLALPSSMIVTKEDFANLRIAEGTEVFFTGLFTPYLGKERNYPIVRFGRLALVTDERIDWDGVGTELYLMEAASYGGNSGSPVFFQVGMEALKPKSLILSGDPMIKLAGIMKGFFSDFQPLKFINTDAIPLAPSNMGIAGVIPVHQLHEILFSDELKQSRGF